MGRILVWAILLLGVGALAWFLMDDGVSGAGVASYVAYDEEDGVRRYAHVLTEKVSGFPCWAFTNSLDDREMVGCLKTTHSWAPEDTRVYVDPAFNTALRTTLEYDWGLNQAR